MLAEAGCLEPEQLFGLLFTQLGSLARLPRRIGQIADRLETGTLKVGVEPTGPTTSSTCCARSRTGWARP